jgi:hypothetical protein
MICMDVNPDGANGKYFRNIAVVRPRVTGSCTAAGVIHVCAEAGRLGMDCSCVLDVCFAVLSG